MSGRERLYAESDRETAEWRALCEAWWETYGDHPVTAKDVFEVAKERGLLLDLWGGRRDLAAQQRIGRALASMRDRVLGPYRIRSAGRDSATRNQAYRLEPIKTSLGVNNETPKTPETPAPTYTHNGHESSLRFRPWAVDLPPELKGSEV